MRALGMLVACLAVFASGGAAASVTVVHFEPLQRLSIGIDPSVLQKPGASAAARLEFDAFGRTFDLRLTPNDRLLSPRALLSITRSAMIYRGELAGRPDSWARIVVAGGVPRGLIWDGVELFAVEAPGDSSVPAGSAVVWRLADAWVPPGAMSCGASPSAAQNAADWFGSVVAEVGTALAQAPGAVSQLDFGMIGDFAFSTRHGVDADVAILTRMNNVDGIYSEQLGVQLNVAELEIFTSAAEPFSATTVPGDLLGELADYRSATPAQRAQGLTHLFTGRDLDGTTVGIAFTDVLCLRAAGAGLTQSGSATIDSLVAAHEIGHNFGAPHDGEAGSACAAETGAFLMAPSVNGSDRFSQCSIDQMQPNIAAASCITPLPTVDLTVRIEGLEEELFLGNDPSIRFVARNIGTEPAANAVLEISLPDMLTLSPDQVTQVACADDGTGLLTCPLGTLAGGSALTANVHVIATSTGSGDVVAAVSADGDDNPANDAETGTTTVLPAVDLAVDPIGAAQVNLDQRTTVGIGVENLSVLGATGVQLTVTFDDGLRAEAATWPFGACTVAALEIDCTAASFAPQSGTTLDIEFTGTAAGQASYTVSLTSLEADADASNNSATGNVTVTDPTASTGNEGDDGGGGALGLLCLLLLAVANCRPGDVRQPSRRRSTRTRNGRCARMPAETRDCGDGAACPAPGRAANLRGFV